MVQGTCYRVHNFLGAPVAQPAPTKFGTKVVIVTYSSNRSCVLNLKLLASTVAERSRGSQIYLDAPLARTPANFGPKSCFLVSYSPSPSCIPNLKLLASTVAEINSGSQIYLEAPLAQTPANFGPKSCFLVRYSLSLCGIEELGNLGRNIDRRMQCSMQRGIMVSLW